MAEAVFTGSFGSNGGGLRAVLTEQNRQPRVHVSPINCKKNHGKMQNQELLER